MPANRIDLYHMLDARNNFDAMRPAPICDDAAVMGSNQYLSRHQNIHISTNCYYGYHDPNISKNTHATNGVIDCEMIEVSESTVTPSLPSNVRKRSADNEEFRQNKRLREEVQKEKKIEPETIEKLALDKNAEDLLESLYWNIHGGNIFHLVQCSLSDDV